MRWMRHYGSKHGQGSSELGWPERQPQCPFRSFALTGLSLAHGHIRICKSGRGAPGRPARAAYRALASFFLVCITQRQCPLWVISGHVQCARAILFVPKADISKQTSVPSATRTSVLDCDGPPPTVYLMHHTSANAGARGLVNVAVDVELRVHHRDVWGKKANAHDWRFAGVARNGPSARAVAASSLGSRRGFWSMHR